MNRLHILELTLKEIAVVEAFRAWPHQRPREIIIVRELPRTATGKLQRFRLREELRRLHADDVRAEARPSCWRHERDEASAE